MFSDYSFARQQVSSKYVLSPLNQAISPVIFTFV